MVLFILLWSSLVLLTQLGGRGNGFIHLSMKEGSLFVLFYFVLFVLARSTKSGCFRLCSWCPLKAPDEEGVHGLGFMTFRLAMQK
jgi:hypothetical protein